MTFTPTLLARAVSLCVAQFAATCALAAPVADASNNVAADTTATPAPGTPAAPAQVQPQGSAPTPTPAQGTTGTPVQDSAAMSVNVTAQRLDQARNGLLPSTGSSIYTINSQAIQQMPTGSATQLNQVLLQAPGVADDSFGQLHVRGDHADLQYRINGIMIPEPISGFGQSIDTRIIDQVSLLTGALPAQYGFRTAGIVDITTKSGNTGNGGTLDMYGGSHQTGQLGGSVYGSSGALSYFFTGSLNVNNLGIEAPTSDGSPLHDHTRQADGFGYLSYVISPLARVSLIFGASRNNFQLPDTPGLPTNFTLAGVSNFNSANLNENQSELNNFTVLALQGTNGGAFDYQVSLFQRYTSTQFTPDPIGDLLFNGVASNDFNSNQTVGIQTDTTYRLTENHTLRAGFYADQERVVSNNSVSVFPADADGNQTSDIPFTIDSSSGNVGHLYGVYLQDEWRALDKLTINYGVRYDRMDEFVSAGQLSPRIGAVYKLTPATTLHAGYSRYFTPPAFELVSQEQINPFVGTTGQAPNQQNSAVQPERDNYYDAGIIQRINPDLTVSLDAYYKQAKDLLDLGQFGTALIFTPFNYAEGHVYGVELSANYHHRQMSAYANVAFSRAQGENVISAQFNLDPTELAFIANHPVFLDHDQRVTISAGGTYDWGRTTFTVDGIYGSGLRSGFANTDKLPAYTQVNFAVIHHFDDTPLIGKFDGRVVLVNAFDRVFELRDGSGIGVGAPQFGPERAIYAGITKKF